jgi:SlyX protein
MRAKLKNSMEPRLNLRGTPAGFANMEAFRSSAMSENDRITELEIRLAYMEDTLAALDKVVSQQTDYIGRLEKAHRRLFDQFSQLRDSADGPAAPAVESPPPHY